ncbi:MAG: hypothetical protein ACLP50_19260 [Solirubrobacteraceae bacterium]
MASTRGVASDVRDPHSSPRRHCDPVGVGATNYFMSANANLENTGGTSVLVLCDLEEGTSVYESEDVTVPANGYAEVAAQTRAARHRRRSPRSP